MELVSDPLHYKIQSEGGVSLGAEKVLETLENHARGGGCDVQEMMLLTSLSESAVRKCLAYLCSPEMKKAKRSNPGERPVKYVPFAYSDSITRALEKDLEDKRRSRAVPGPLA
jgi:hypothetical protein